MLSAQINKQFLILRQPNRSRKTKVFAEIRAIKVKRPNIGNLAVATPFRFAIGVKQWCRNAKRIQTAAVITKNDKIKCRRCRNIRRLLVLNRVNVNRHLFKANITGHTNGVFPHLDVDSAICNASQIGGNIKIDFCQSRQIKVPRQGVMAAHCGFIGKTFNPLDVGSPLPDGGITAKIKPLGIDLQFKCAVCDIKIAKCFRHLGIFNPGGSGHLDIIECDRTQ